MMLDNGSSAAKVLFHLDARGGYSSALIKRRRYLTENVPVEGVGKLCRTNKLEIRKFCKHVQKNENLFCYFVHHYVMELVASWMDLDEFLGNNSHIDWQENG